MNFKDIDQLLIKKLPVNESKKTLLKRRLNKLKRDPKGFLEGSYKKRSTQVRKYVPIKYSGTNHFTVVSAVYNVEKYLEEYFKSITNQSLSFKKHIQLILVDDGSTDSSAEIIEKWQKKYPRNITYLYKENGGQSSARNLGLESVTTEWVTFVDPDDFINIDYFRILDKALVKDECINMMVANIQLFMENENEVRDKHPLRFRFVKEEVTLPSYNMGDYINLSAAATIFRMSYIRSRKVLFSERVKPNFEDGKFIADYLISDKGKVSFLKNAIYLYRKRSDKSSTVDTSWVDKRKYNDVLKEGYLEVLSSYNKNLGYVPKHIQRTVLYDIGWYLRLLMNNPEGISFLGSSEKDIFYNLIKIIFTFIEVDTILDFNLSGIWFLYKVGMVEAFKEQNVNNKIVYIENIDQDKKQILLSYFTYKDISCSFQLNESDTLPLYFKKLKHTFIDRLFIQEVRSWVPFKEPSEYLNVVLDGKQTRVSLQGQQYRKGLKVSEILEAFKPSSTYSTDGSWLLMDKDTHADDNAEHFYRYLMQNHKELDCYFALRKDSNDWLRLYNEGFNLVDFNSIEFEEKLKSSSKIISSHLDKYINNYFGDEYEYSKKFIFLQHGVIMNDLSDWFSSKKNLQCVITTTHQEYQALTKGDERYKLTEKEVVLTGLPRHDKLLLNNNYEAKVILIMPTWRRDIMGEIIGAGNIREINEEFSTSIYAENWRGFLNNIQLKKLSEEYQYRVIFAPHANIEPYISEFNLPSYIEVWRPSNKLNSMQKLFQESTFMITDYSSVAFEMGILGKTVVYYQFDQESFFSNGHLFKSGYFSYEKNGFGPVVTNEESLLKELETIVQNEGRALEPYKTRMSETFPLRDGMSCMRVYQAIMALDEPETKNVDLDILYEFTIHAYQYKAWDLVEIRSKLMLECDNQTQQSWSKNLLNEALFHQNKFSELFDQINTLDSVSNNESYWLAKVAFATANWDKAINTLEALPEVDEEMSWMLLVSYAEVGNVKSYSVFKESFKEAELSLAQSIMIEARYLQASEQWELLIEFLDPKLTSFDTQELRDYEPQILIGQAYRHLEDFDKAHKYLITFEGHTPDSTRCAIEIAQLAFERHNFSKCITQYVRAVSNNLTLLAEAYAVQYAQALDIVGEPVNVVHQLTELSDIHSDNQVIQVLLITALARCGKWHEVIETAIKYELLTNEDTIYPLTLARYRLGKLEEAYKNLLKPINTSSYEYWSLVAELAFLMEDFELAKFCYKMMIALYPHEDTKGNWTKLNHLRACS